VARITDSGCELAGEGAEHASLSGSGSSKKSSSDDRETYLYPLSRQLVKVVQGYDVCGFHEEEVDKEKR
jgi:hypothetical protein